MAHIDIDTSANLYKTEILSGWEKLYKLKMYKLHDIFKEFYKGERALELGISDGEATQHIVPYFKEVHVVDASLEFIKQSQKKFPSIITHHCYFEKFNPDTTFSTVFMSHILEHLDDPLLVLNKVYNWLDKGGIGLISVPNALSLHRRMGAKMGLIETPYSLNSQDKLLGHRRVYDSNTMRDLIAQTQFKIKKFTGLMIKPLSNRQMESTWTDEMIDACFAVGEDLPDLCAEIVFVVEK